MTMPLSDDIRLFMFELSETISKEFFEFILGKYALSPDGNHGPEHWKRVLINGRILSAKTGANLKVVELFALLHDSCRLKETGDPDHGLRASQFAKKLQGHWFHLNDQEMKLLCDACIDHSRGFLEADITVQTCWDSDRLDLGRAGINPLPRYLCTDYAKQSDILDSAYYRSIGEKPPY